MKRYIAIVLILLLLVSGCAATRQTLINELSKNPNTELAAEAVQFFQNYGQAPAKQIELSYEDETVTAVNDPILIGRFYKYLTQIMVKSKITADKASGERVEALLSNEEFSVPFEFIGDYLIWGDAAYELGDASKLLRLTRQFRDESTPAHTKEFESYTARIDSLVNHDNILTADVEFTNTSEEEINSIEATVVFIDFNGKIMATKKINTTLDNPLKPGAVTWIAVSCEYKDSIEDVTFSE